MESFAATEKKQFPYGFRLNRQSFYLVSIAWLVLWCLEVGCNRQTPMTDTSIPPTAVPPNGLQPNAKVPTDTEQSSTSVDRKKTEVPQPSTTAIQFEDVVAESGVTDILVSGIERRRFGMIESVGAGISLLDYDLDGLKDIALPGGSDRAEDGKVVGFSGGLHRATAPFVFAPVTKSARFNLSSFASQDVAVGDIDSDGFNDFFVSGFGGVQCFLNQGDGTFAKLSTASGLTCDLWSSSSVVADLNGDTFPDIYVVRYINWSETNDNRCYSRASPSTPAMPVSSDKSHPIACGPLSFDAYDDMIFFSNGDGTFTNVSSKAGVAKGGRGLAILAADLDDDRDLEIYVANDADQNFLYRNNGDGTLSEVAVRSGVAMSKDGVSQGSMGISIGDLSGDKKPDLFISNFMRELPAIYISRGRLNFRFNTAERGIDLLGEEHVSWGTSMTDFDNDGDEDVVVVSGNVDKDETRDTYNQTPSLLENLGNGNLHDNSQVSGGFFVTGRPARGLATADFDGDGKVDFVTSNLDRPIGLLKNVSSSTKHWLQINAIGVKSARNPIGTSIELQSGDKCWVRQVVAGGSFSSSSDPVVHIGVGMDASLPAKLTLRWPSGVTDELQVDRWDQKLTIFESTQ